MSRKGCKLVPVVPVSSWTRGEQEGCKLVPVVPVSSWTRGEQEGV